jgi:hypothetical protein
MGDLSRACRKLRERLPEYLEGGLAGPARSAVARHLAVCSRCASELDDLRTVMAALHSVAPDAVPEHLVPRVRRAAYATLRSGEAPSLRSTSRATPSSAVQFWARITVPVALATGLVALAFALRTAGPPRLAEKAAPSAPTTSAPVSAPVAAAPRPSAPAGPPAPVPPPVALPRQAVAQPRPLALAPRALTQEERPAATAKVEAGPPAEIESTAKPAEERSLGARVSQEVGEGRAGAAGARIPPKELKHSQGHPAGTPMPRQAPARGRQRWYGNRAESRPPGPAFKAKGHAGGMAGGGMAGGGAGLAADRALARLAPTFARASLTQVDGRPAISLQLGAPEVAGEIRVSIGSGPDRRTLWRGPAGKAAPFLLVPSDLGPGPANIPITIESPAGAQEYMLFAPTTARLGEVAPRSPRVHYDGQPLRKALSDLSSLTGLVVLAEGPLDRKVVGDLAAGTPESALQELAAGAGLQVQRQDHAVYLLTPRR